MRNEAEVNRAIDLYADTVRRICFLYLKNDADVDDIFQEGEGYLEENRHFITCIEKNIPVGCDITVGREVLAISRKILDSSIRGR